MNEETLTGAEREAGYVMAWCTEHGDLFRTMRGSTSEREKLCAACAIRREERDDRREP